MITNYLTIAFEGLKKLSYIHKYRVKAYEQAERKATGTDLKHFIIDIIRESEEFNDDLENLLIEIEKECTLNYKEEDLRLHQSQFYYAVAKSQSNSRTVFLSCLLGDSYSLKAYHDLLNYQNISLFPAIKTKLETQLKKIMGHIERIEIFQVSTQLSA
jgi:hypothetical protein